MDAGPTVSPRRQAPVAVGSDRTDDRSQPAVRIGGFRCIPTVPDSQLNCPAGLVVAFDRCIAALTTCAVPALPCSICPRIPPWMENHCVRIPSHRGTENIYRPYSAMGKKSAEARGCFQL